MKKKEPRRVNGQGGNMLYFNPTAQLSLLKIAQAIQNFEADVQTVGKHRRTGITKPPLALRKARRRRRAKMAKASRRRNRR